MARTKGAPTRSLNIKLTEDMAERLAEFCRNQPFPPSAGAAAVYLIERGLADHETKQEPELKVVKHG